MINALTSQPAPQRPERGPLEPKPRLEASGGGVTGDVLVTTRGAGLESRNVFAQLTSDDLIDLLQTGTLPPERTPISLDQVSKLGANASVLHLSDEGKKAHLSKDGLADALGSGKSQGLLSKAPISLDTHVEAIFLSPENRDLLFRVYGERVARGEAPEEIAGKPFKTYFEHHVQGTDDLLAEMELKNFRKQIPGFSSLTPAEQRVRAALGGQMAESLPKVLPGDIRRQMANSMIRHKAFDRATPGAGLDVAGEIKPFFHGTTSGRLISHIGFRGQPEQLYKKLPTGAQKVLKERFGVNFRSMYGPGVYYGNAAIAGSYALNKSKATNKPVHVVSGWVALGKTTVQAADVGADTRILPKADSKGAYYITQDPRRFTVTGLTTLDPKQTDAWMRYFPDLLKAHGSDPYAIGGLVDRLPKGPSRRALEEAAKGADPAMARTATLLLARRGDQKALNGAIKVLEGVSSYEELDVVKSTLLPGLTSVGPGHFERTGPVAEALMKTGLRVLPSTSVGRHDLATDLYKALGDEVLPLVGSYGFEPTPRLPAEGVFARAKKVAEQGLKRLF